MIGTKFYKPLELDKLTRTVTRQVEREIEEQIAVPVDCEIKHTIQEPVYDMVTTDSGEHVQVIVGYTDKEVTETVQDVEYRTEKKTVTEDIQEQEEYDNPAPNTLTRYCEAVQWANANRAYIVEREPDTEYPNGYYEVVAIPEPTPEELAAEALAQAKAERAAAVAALTVEVDGMVFDGDEAAQERMARAVTMADSMDETTEWVLADNTVAVVTAEQLRRACRAAGKAQTTLWVKPYLN